MQLFVDYLPILIFFGAYFYKGIYFATGVLMVVMPVVMVAQWAITKKLNKIYAASTALVLILGSATLLLRNPLFLYWKPTVLNWAIGLAFLGSQFIGEKPFAQRMLGGAASLEESQWRRLNQIWVAFLPLHRWHQSLRCLHIQRTDLGEVQAVWHAWADVLIRHHSDGLAYGNDE